MCWDLSKSSALDVPYGQSISVNLNCRPNVGESGNWSLATLPSRRQQLRGMTSINYLLKSITLINIYWLCGVHNYNLWVTGWTVPTRVEILQNYLRSRKILTFRWYPIWRWMIEDSCHVWFPRSVVRSSVGNRICARWCVVGGWMRHCGIIE